MYDPARRKTETDFIRVSKPIRGGLALHVGRRIIRPRVVQVDGVRYAAYSAHELLESEEAGVRPGHPIDTS